MAQEWAKQFYSSKVWQDCRNDYARQRRHLCERCLLRGQIVPGEIVHHRTPLTPETINDPAVTLAFDNLELLCRDCHAEQHKAASKGRRFVIDDFGKVIAWDD